MSKDLAIGIIIGGAVSSTLGQAVNKTKQSIDGLRKKLDDTSSVKKLVGETQRLQKEMQATEAASRRLGLENVRSLKGEVANLKGQWHEATENVAKLSQKLSEAKKTGAGSGNLHNVRRNQLYALIKKRGCNCLCEKCVNL